MLGVILSQIFYMRLVGPKRYFINSSTVSHTAPGVYISGAEHNTKLLLTMHQRASISSGFGLLQWSEYRLLSCIPYSSADQQYYEAIFVYDATNQVLTKVH